MVPVAIVTNRILSSIDFFHGESDHIYIFQEIDIVDFKYEAIHPN